MTSEKHAAALSEDKFQRRIKKLCRKVEKRERRAKVQREHSSVDESLFQAESKENQLYHSNHSQQLTN